MRGDWLKLRNILSITIFQGMVTLMAIKTDASGGQTFDTSRLQKMLDHWRIIRTWDEK